MVIFFFYKYLTSERLIKQISENFEICDGHVNIHNYDNVQNRLEFDRDPSNNSMILHGKIVTFNMKLCDVMNKIHDIRECRFKNRPTYTMETILAYRPNGDICDAYIVY